MGSSGGVEVLMGQDGTESVWEYPRPPRLENCGRLVRVVHGGVVLVESSQTMRVLETSHPPVYYIPQGDVAMEWMRRSVRRRSFCEFKGVATYWSVEVPGKISVDAAWSYGAPTKAFAGLKDCLAFYASRVDECSVDGQRVEAQEGDFYGGWITSWVKGPFKGAPGTLGW